MIDLKSFCKKIQHAKDRKGQSEQADCKAVEIDGNNGLYRQFIIPNSEHLSRVDYCDILENTVQLIEMKDLKSKIKDMNRKLNSLDGTKKQICKNLENKYRDSKIIIKQLYKKQNNGNNPDYKFLLVVKNDTDILAMDSYLNGLKQTTEFMICRTNQVCDHLIGQLCRD